MMQNKTSLHFLFDKKARIEIQCGLLFLIRFVKQALSVYGIGSNGAFWLTLPAPL